MISLVRSGTFLLNWSNFSQMPFLVQPNAIMTHMADSRTWLQASALITQPQLLLQETDVASKNFAVAIIVGETGLIQSTVAMKQRPVNKSQD